MSRTVKPLLVAVMMDNVMVYLSRPVECRPRGTTSGNCGLQLVTL